MSHKPPFELKKITFFLVIFLITSLSLVFFKNIFKNQCGQLDCLNFTGIANYSLSETYQSDKNSFRGLYQGKDENIRISIKNNIPKTDAQEETSIMITQMKKLFEKERSPYPGEISDVVECDEKYIPKWNKKETNGVEVNYATAYLNDRLVYGACTEEQLTNESLFLAFYCLDQQKLYQIEIITGKDKFEVNENRYMDMLDSISCK